MNLAREIRSLLRQRAWGRAPGYAIVLARRYYQRVLTLLPSRWRLERPEASKKPRAQPAGLQNRERRPGAAKKRVRKLKGELGRERSKNRRLRRRIREVTLESQILERQLAHALGLEEAEQGTRFFLVGEMKSGTSWLMWLLASHPEIFCSGEGDFFGRDQKNQETEEIPVLKHPTPSLRNALLSSEGLRTWQSFMWWNYWAQQGGDADGDLRNLTRLAIDYYLMQGSAVSGKPIVGDKSPPHTDYVDEIHELYPEAKVIHIVRDGRDVAVSLMHHYWSLAKDINKKNGIYEVEPEERTKRDAYRRDPEGFLASGQSIFTEERLRQIAGRWSRRVSKASHDGTKLFGDSYLQLYYEDLLARPEENMKRVFGLLGARADDEVVESCIEQNSFQKLAERPGGQEDSTSFFRKGVVGDWRKVFTERDRKTYEEIAGETLLAMGYPLTEARPQIG